MVRQAEAARSSTFCQQAGYVVSQCEKNDPGLIKATKCVIGGKPKRENQVLRWLAMLMRLNIADAA